MPSTSQRHSIDHPNRSGLGQQAMAHNSFKQSSHRACFARDFFTFLGLDLKGRDLTDADAMCYFRCQHGLQCGRPVKKFFLPWSADLPPIMLEDVHCDSRRLCYQIFSTEEFQMLNLETGKRSMWTKSEGTKYHPILSDRYLVLISMGE